MSSALKTTAGAALVAATIAGTLAVTTTPAQAFFPYGPGFHGYGPYGGPFFRRRFFGPRFYGAGFYGPAFYGPSRCRPHTRETPTRPPDHRHRTLRRLTATPPYAGSLTSEPARRCPPARLNERTSRFRSCSPWGSGTPQTSLCNDWRLDLV